MRELREILADIDDEAKTKPGYGTDRAMRYIDSKYYHELRRALRHATEFVRIIPGVLQSYTIGESTNGRSGDFDSPSEGSSPSSPTIYEYSEKGPFIE